MIVAEVLPSPRCWGYFIFLAFAIGAFLRLAPRYGKRHELVYLTLCSLISSVRAAYAPPGAHAVPRSHHSALRSHRALPCSHTVPSPALTQCPAHTPATLSVLGR